MSSYEKINYSIRPCKQIERKIIIDGINSLNRLDFNIRDYLYVGFGSIYYYDFMLVHKYLHINDMICIEKDDIELRMDFNKPYDFIDLKIGDFSDYTQVIMNMGKKVFAWFDFDSILSMENLTGLSNFLSLSEVGSIFIITINAFPNSYLEKTCNEMDKSTNIIADLKSEFDLLVDDLRKVDVTKANFPETLTNIIKKQIDSALVSYPKKFHQLFNYTHKDGTSMLTYGGIVTDIDNNDNYINEYFNKDLKPKAIKAPSLTNREKKYFDSNLNSTKELIKKIGVFNEFEIATDDVLGYLEYYKYYPEYFESIF